MKITPKTALSVGVGILAVSVAIAAATIETGIREGAWAPKCGRLGSDWLKEYCVGRWTARENAKLGSTLFSKFSKDGSLASGFLTSVRSSQGVSHVVLFDPVSMKYRPIGTYPQTIVQSSCATPEGRLFVGTRYATGKNAGVAYSFDSALRKKNEAAFRETRNVRDCVFTNGTVALSAHSLGGGIFAQDGKEIVRSVFGKGKTSVTSNHEIVSFDLDSDGVGETYITPTIDNETIIYKLQFQDSGYLTNSLGGAIERLDFKNGKASVTQIEAFTGGYVKQVFPIANDGEKILLALKSDVSSATTEVLGFSYESGKPAKTSLATIPKRECRSTATGNFGHSGANLAIGCEKGFFLFAFDGKTLSLKKSYDLAPVGDYNPDPNDHQVHALAAVSGKDGSADRLLVGTDMDGIHLYNLENDSVDELVELGQGEYVWFFEPYGK